MDKFETQSGGHVKEGHQEGDLSIRGIVLSGVFLAVSGALAFILMIGFIHFLEKMEQNNEAKLTPMERQLQQEREAPKEGGGKEIPAYAGEIKPAPDSYGRAHMDNYLNRTFKAPRLQYDDEHDMGIFRSSEDNWLSKTGKDAEGNIHIPIDHAMEILAKQGLPQVSGPFLPANQGAPSAQYPTGASSSAQAAPGSTGAQKK